MSEIIDKQKLTELFINNPGLQDIETHLSRFNPFTVLNVAKYEIRHSSMLAWLLDPAETHGFGDAFLKAILCETFRHAENEDAPSALDIHLSDLSQAQVLREKSNIDLLIECPVNRWFFVIENKFYSKQGKGQLTHYKEHIKKRAKKEGLSYKTGHIFLTLNEEDPDDDAYVHLSYETVCLVLKDLQDRHQTTQSNEVSPFIKQYIEILEDETGMSQNAKDIKQLAKSLYREHRRVIDFVVEHGQSTDFGFAAEAITGDVEWLESYQVKEQKFVHGHIGKRQFSFLPYSWYKALGKKELDYPGCEKWGSGYPVICWLQLAEETGSPKGTLYLFAEVGPIKDPEVRVKFITSIKEAAANNRSLRVGFSSIAQEPGRKYSKFLKKNSVKITDTSDTDKLTKAMEELLLRFQTEYEALVPALKTIRSYGQG